MIVFFNNNFCDEHEATIPFRNRGMYFGEGIFETMRAYNGKVFALDQHLERLLFSAKYFSLLISFSISELKEIIHQLLQMNNLRDAIVRLTLSGGEISPANHFCSKPTNSFLIIEAKEFLPTFSSPVSLHLSEYQLAAKDELRKHKITNYLRSIHTLRKFDFEDAGKNEVLFLDEHNYILEGTRTNIFLVLGEAIVTPTLDCDVLPGITRSIIKEICEECNIFFEERLIHASALSIAAEIFLTNSVAEIVSVSQMKEKTRRDNSLTKRMQELFYERVQQETRSSIV
ncbi:MAG: aminotransferase class IV [Ignavibacteriales bacterium]|nr:aminotransferase class IV [Ignavibacteriales bacterium]